MVSPTTWALTVALIVALLTFDFIFHVRKAHTPTIKEAAKWTAIYVSLAISFGVWVWMSMGPQSGLEYYAGYITELSLSVDNLFVFLIIMSSFKVPRADQQKVLMFGIVVSLIARSAFIFVGVALINSFSWVFYIFGIILLWTAANLLKPEEEESEGAEANNGIIRLAKKFMHTTNRYDGDKLFTIENGKKVMTPMLLVMVAIGGTDVMFALDSIPAIFGLTQNSYIVFTAVAFSLMGLRQLYFLIDGLLDRLIYLKYGLAVILAFIGVKLVLHALHENTLPFINGGQHLPVFEISTQLSLAVIVLSLLVVIVASLMSPKGKVLTTFKNARRQALRYIDLEAEATLDERKQTYVALVASEEQITKVPAQYLDLLREQQSLLDVLDEAHEAHATFVAENADAFTGEPIAVSSFDTKAYRL